MTASSVVAWLESPRGELWSRNHHKIAGAAQFMYGTDDGGWVFAIVQVHSGNRYSDNLGPGGATAAHMGGDPGRSTP